MEDTYDGVLVIPVKIPAALIEGQDGTFAEYDDVEEKVLATAEFELQNLIVALRAEAVHV